MGSGIPENHCQLTQFVATSKLYNAKQKPYINNIQKCRWLLCAQAHLRWTDAKWKSVLWSDESTFQIIF